jgi:predicted SAM-dependent methyltransferase
MIAADAKSLALGDGYAAHYPTRRTLDLEIGVGSSDGSPSTQYATFSTPQMTTNVPSYAAYVLPDGPKLNLGCGPVQPAAWVNVDGSNRARLAGTVPWLDGMFVRAGVLSPTEFGPHVTVCNLLRPWRWASGSVACIYAGELWEHFEYPDAVRITAEAFRVLAPGGVLRVCVPDGPDFWRKYLALFETERARPKHERSAEALRQHVALYFREICTRRLWFGSMGQTHKWQFDEIQLVELFEQQGFTDVARQTFHVSRIPDVHLVERSDFLIVEGIKPMV